MFDDKQETVTSRRGILAKATELAAVAPLVALGITNVRQQDTHKEINLSEATLAENPIHKADALQGSFLLPAKMKQQIEQLLSAYEVDYQKTKPSLSTGVGFDGELRTKVTQEEYWDIPDGLIAAEVIEEWSKQTEFRLEKVDLIANRKLVDIQRLEKLAIETNEGSSLAKQALTALVYGGSIGALLGYEEILAFGRSKLSATNYHHERFEKSTRAQETRRGFFKIGAALLGSGAALAIHQRVQGRIDSGEKRLSDELDDVAQLAREKDEAAIESFFETSLDDQIGTIITMNRNLRAALDSKAASAAVQSEMESLLQIGEEFAEKLQAVKDDPRQLEQLATLAKCSLATDQLEAANTAEKRLAAYAGIFEGLGIAGVMSVVIVPGAIYNARNPGEDLLEKVKKGADLSGY